LSMSGVARGGFFLFVGNITASVIGTIYWLLLSVTSGPGTVGVASAILGLGTLVSGIATLGVPVGAMRFIGREYGLKRIERLSSYFWSSFTLTITLCLISRLRPILRLHPTSTAHVA